MTLLDIERRLAESLENDPGNHIDEIYALRPEYVGMPIFESPLVGCAAASDPLFEHMRQRADIYGPTLRMPEEWLPGAVSVVSFFLPFSKAVRDSNRADLSRPSDLWLHGRFEGQEILNRAAASLADLLQEAGGKVVIPATDPAFTVVRDPARMERGEPPYVSNWSERHAAFVAGLGTFSLSKHLITEKGVSGRFGSVITNLPLPATPRPYTDPYEYCTFCGACRKRCSVNAIGPLEKDNRICSDFQRQMLARFAPRHGCGKCQLSVPCETRRPK
jgi:epoxyqueuosine reductase QueG